MLGKQKQFRVLRSSDAFSSALLCVRLCDLCAGLFFREQQWCAFTLLRIVGWKGSLREDVKILLSFVYHACVVHWEGSLKRSS